MSNVKISELPISIPTSTSIFPFVDNGITYHGAISAITTPYKVYTALLTQTGSYPSVPTGPNFVIGQTYVITFLGVGDDFINIGFVSLNTPFIAIGTTATVWLNGSSAILIDENVFPTLTILENTLGITLVSDFNNTSSFKLISDLPVFLENKTIITPNGFFNNNLAAQAKGGDRLDDYTLIYGGISPLGTFRPFPIEIKVYN